MKPTLGMVVAMASEARLLLGRGPWRQVKRHLVRCARLKDGTDLIVTRAGVGVENAFRAARWLISEGVTALTSMGVAGGLCPGLKAGHLIIAEDVLTIDHGKSRGPWKADATCVAHARAAFAAEGVCVACGTVLTAPAGVLTAAQKESLFRQTRALAVDMESAAVARAALEKNLPFFTLRAICDPAEETVPRALYDCLDKNGKVRLTAVLLNLAGRPSLALDLRRMSIHYSAAKTALKDGWRIQIKNNLPRILASRHQEDAMPIDD